jgi:transposase
MRRTKKQSQSRRQRTCFYRKLKRKTVCLVGMGQKPATQPAVELGVARNQSYKWQALLRKHGEAACFAKQRPSYRLSLPAYPVSST